MATTYETGTVVFDNTGTKTTNFTSSFTASPVVSATPVSTSSHVKVYITSVSTTQFTMEISGAAHENVQVNFIAIQVV